MLTVTIPPIESFDETLSKFVYSEEVTLELEHSLVSLSKWESKYEKPFLGKEEHSNEETLDYIRIMTLTPGISPEVYSTLPPDIVNQVGDYINAKMTATWFSEHANTRSGAGSGEVITAEIIYYWLIALTIPFEVQEWHLNRLLTLIRVVNIKNDPKKKMMPKKEAAAQQRDLNAERKARMGTKG